MNVYEVPESLDDAYKGAGVTLAAVAGGQLIHLVYLRDIIPDFEDNDAASVITDYRLGPTIRFLETLGDVSIGMCSCREFVEL